MTIILHCFQYLNFVLSMLLLRICCRSLVVLQYMVRAPIPYLFIVAGQRKRGRRISFPLTRIHDAYNNRRLSGLYSR